MSYSWVPYKVHVQVELGVETLDSTSEVVLGSPVAPTQLPDCLVWICPAPFSDKITQKSPPEWSSQAGEVAVTASNETFIDNTEIVTSDKVP